MKTNEAPDKIWMDLGWIPHFDCKDCITEDSVEYTRTDAFIEKACNYLMEYEFNDSPTIADRRKRVDEFVNYMKGE